MASWLSALLAGIVTGLIKWLATDEKSFTPKMEDSKPNDELKSRLHRRIADYRAGKLREGEDGDLHK